MSKREENFGRATGKLNERVIEIYNQDLVACIRKVFNEVKSINYRLKGIVDQ